MHHANDDHKEKIISEPREEQHNNLKNQYSKERGGVVVIVSTGT
jgi:hypothetical protein